MGLPLANRTMPPTPLPGAAGARVGARSMPRPPPTFSTYALTITPGPVPPGLALALVAALERQHAPALGHALLASDGRAVYSSRRLPFSAREFVVARAGPPAAAGGRFSVRLESVVVGGCPVAVVGVGEGEESEESEESEEGEESEGEMEMEGMETAEEMEVENDEDRMEEDEKEKEREGEEEDEEDEEEDEEGRGGRWEQGVGERGEDMYVYGEGIRWLRVR